MLSGMPLGATGRGLPWPLELSAYVRTYPGSEAKESQRRRHGKHQAQTEEKEKEETREADR